MVKGILLILLSSLSFAQVKYKFEEEEFLLNRAVKDIGDVQFDSQQEKTSNYFKTYKLTHKFLDEKKWEERSQVVVGYDKRGNLIEVTVKSQLADLKDKFETACQNGQLY